MKVADLTVEEFRELVREIVCEALDNHMTVADLTPEEFREVVRESVWETFMEFRDTDEGELRPEFVEELERRMAEERETYTEDEVRRELGL